MVEKFDPNTWTGKVEVDGQEIELALVDEESAEGEAVSEATAELELEPLPNGMYDVEPREETVIESEEIPENLEEEIDSMEEPVLGEPKMESSENTNTLEEVNEKNRTYSEQEIDELLEFSPSKSEEAVEKNVKQTPDELIKEIMNSSESVKTRYWQMDNISRLQNHPVVKAMGDLDKQMSGRENLNSAISLKDDFIKAAAIGGPLVGTVGVGAIGAGLTIGPALMMFGLATGVVLAGAYGIKGIGNLWYGRKIRKANERLSELGYPVTK